MRSLSFRRSFLTLGAVLALTVAGALPAAAATTTGQVGHFAIGDVEGAEIVNCRYNDASGTPKLDKFVAKPPKVWWPDTDSGNDNQQGKVGWRIVIQKTGNPDTGPWSTTYRSTWVKKTAREDQPFQDAADAAPFTARGILWNRTGNNTVFRVIYVLRWYRANGTVMGTAKHTVVYYNITGDGNGDFIGGCSNKLLA
jgi:hypothetical protein